MVFLFNTISQNQCVVKSALIHFMSSQYDEKKIESETINVRRKIYNGQNDTTTNSEWNIKEVVYKFVHQ